MNKSWKVLGRSGAIQAILADLERLLPNLGPARRIFASIGARSDLARAEQALAALTQGPGRG